MTTDLPVAGLYLHIPYCAAICPYCDFAVRKGDTRSGHRLVEALVDELRGLREGRLLPEATELAAAVGRLASSRFDTLYLGGGTPSLLAASDLERLLEVAGAVFGLEDSAHLSLEANPEHVTLDTVAMWRGLGIRTLSLGVQALDDEALRFLGRAHDVQAATRAVELASRAGFETVSIDLIYGLPAQTEDSWRRQLDDALQLPIDHLSLYELEIHHRTVFGKRLARGELEPLEPDSRASLFLATHQRLREAGWDPYEVSNFARTPFHRSRHNEKYWRHVPYLGLGPAAHSLAVDPDFGLWRFWNEPSEPRWRKHLRDGHSAAAGWERLPPAAIALEATMLGLRTRDGLSLSRLQELAGLDLLDANRQRLDTWIEAGWIRRQGDRLHPSTEGMARADALAAQLDLGP